MSEAGPRELGSVLLEQSLFKSQTIAILQHPMGYGRAFTEVPTGEDEIACLKDACSTAAAIGGNPWDAAALFMLAKADARLKASPLGLTDEDRRLLARAAGSTLGLSHLQAKPDLLLNLVRDLSKLYTAHPSHPAHTK